MSKTYEQIPVDLDEIVELVVDGSILALEGLTRLARAHPSLRFIGTARSASGYDPRCALTSFTQSDQPNPFEDCEVGWRPRVTAGPRGGTIPVVRAGNIPGTAIWSALGGDANYPLQRAAIDAPIFPWNKQDIFEFGIHAWAYSEEEKLYLYGGHPNLLLMLQDPTFPGNMTIGATDIVVGGDEFSIEIPGEPGHYASRASIETRATMPVRLADARALLPDAVMPAYLTYHPLRPSDTSF